ncbi:MAG: biotin--[acetyl-CoA-carboxylase] ligase [Bacteroidales bacterium]
MKPDIVFLESTASTNTSAQQFLNDSRASEGSVIWAAGQFEGRGQGSNSWHSQPGLNLTFSLVLEPLFLPPDRQFSLNKAMALGVLQTVRQALPHDISACIKWPNDIYASGKKISGILIEHSIQGNVIKNSIIGIGINLNQDEFPAWLPKAVSLKQLSGSACDIREMLEKTCANLAGEYARLKNDDFQAVQTEYNSSLCGCGRDLEFTAGSSSFTARIGGVDDFGRLCVLTADGGVRVFSHGEISFSEVRDQDREI